MTVPVRPALRYTRTGAGGAALYLLYIRAIRDWAITSSRQWTNGSLTGMPVVATSSGNDPAALCPDSADWIGPIAPFGQATFEPASGGVCALSPTAPPTTTEPTVDGGTFSPTVGPSPSPTDRDHRTPARRG